MYSARSEVKAVATNVIKRCRPGSSVLSGSAFLVLLTLVFSLFRSQLLHAQEIQLPLSLGEPEAWLVTYAPGDAYWQRFGHNAIWIRDPTRGIDHVFNFGFFDFNQENFFQRFIQGRMLYFSAAQAVADEFRQYQLEKRTINVQKLILGLVEYERLLNHLMNQTRLENRDYLYDYYLDNCSTRVRDAIDIAVNGAIREQASGQTAEQNLRSHTRRSVSMDFWYYLALESALGLPVDRQITRWDEMFLPAVVAAELGSISRDGRPLISAGFTVFEGKSVETPVVPPNSWWIYLGAGFALTAVFVLLGHQAGPVMSQGTVNAWLMISASAGLLLAYLWFMTSHDAAGPNINLLLLNPLFALGLWPALRKFAVVTLAGGLLLALVQALLPSGQYNLDVLMFLLPLNAAAACWLWKNPGR